MTRALFLLPFLLLAAPGFQRGEEPSHIYAVGEKYAMLMGPPEIVANAYGRQMTWTADGSNLVVERLIVGNDVSAAKLVGARQTEDLSGIAALASKSEIVAWNLRSGRLRTLLTLGASTSNLDALEAIPNSDRVCVSLTHILKDPASGAVKAQSGFLIVSTETGNTLTVEQPPNGYTANLEFSSKGQAVMILRGVASRSTSVALVLPNGRLGPVIPVPPRNQFEFLPNGSAALSSYSVSIDDGVSGQRRLLNLATGALGAPTPVKVAMEEGAMVPSSATGTTPSTGPGGPPPKLPEIGVYEMPFGPKSQGVVLRLAPGKPEELGIVTTDGSRPGLSPKRDAVWYQSSGSVFVRRLTKLSLDQFRAALEEAEKAKAMDRGKKIGTALAIYAMDADDIMPPPGTNISEVVAPYARNRSVFDGFVYTYGGASGPDGPGKTELGYIAAPGGRVVVYGDGHVGWVPDGP